MEDSYPPVLSAKEIAQTAAAGICTGRGENTQAGDHAIDKDTHVRIVRPNVARIGMSERNLDMSRGGYLFMYICINCSVVT